MTEQCKSITMEDRYYGRQLAERRSRLRLTLREVSEGTGIPFSMLWYYENAYTRCHPDKRAQLEAFYGRREAQWFREGGDMEHILGAAVADLTNAVRGLGIVFQYLLSQKQAEESEGAADDKR